MLRWSLFVALRRQASLVLASALVSAASAASLFGQDGSLHVTARADGGAVLSGVRVQVLDDDRVGRDGITSQNGELVLRELAPGEYVVVLELTGWETVTRTGVVVEPGSTTQLIATLLPAPFSLNPITVSAGRTEDKLLEAPASITVLDQQEIESRPALTVTDHLEGVVGVDVSRTSLENANIVTRGFNSLLTAATMILIDNRLARVPGTRANIIRHHPLSNFDIERIEVVRGPGSALYGLNADQGVIHIITRSPIDDPGVDVAISGSVRDQGDVTGFSSSSEGVFLGEARVAKRFSDQFGAKLSGRYFSGTDWRFQDPVEVQNALLAEQCTAFLDLANPACIVFSPAPDELPDPDQLGRIGDRNFDVGNWSLDGRADWRPQDDVSVILNTGLEYTIRSFDVTPAGATQVNDHVTHYSQVRVNADEFFGQVFLNRNAKPGNDPTYFLRSGASVPDESWSLGVQAQHASSLGENTRLVYGADFLRLNPDGQGSLTGIYEPVDGHSEIGVYAQSETSLSEKWALTLALRSDWHTVLDKAMTSPRVGVEYTPSVGHHLRATFNRAFTTPSPTDLFIDLSAQRLPLGGPFSYDLRAQGTARDGFTFSDIDGRPGMKSPFSPLIGAGAGDFLPTTTENLYVLARELLRASGSPAAGLMDAVGVPTEDQVAVSLLILDLENQLFEPFEGGFDGIEDIPAIDEQTTTTIEVGYRGLVDERLLVSADVYYLRKDNYIGPALIETPNAFLDGAQLTQFFIDSGVDAPTAQALAVGTPDAPGIAAIPLGVVVPTEVQGAGAQILLTGRNWGSVDVIGADLDLRFQVNPLWSLGLAASLVSDDTFDADGLDIALNAPTVKLRGSATYTNEERGLTARVNFRYVNEYPVRNAVYVGTANAYSLTDVGFGWDLPGMTGATVQLDFRNVFNNEYRSFVGVPLMGRISTVRLIYSF